MKILLIEDQEELQGVIKTSLEKQNYLVEQAYSKAQALDKITGYDYDCILLDIMLPDGSGIDILTQIKKLKKHEAVIIISAKDAIEDKVLGLEIGADDYLTKPFHLSELVARIKSVLRRKLQAGQRTFSIANITIDSENRSVCVGANCLLLNNKEYELLYFFCVNVNRLITKSSLAEHIWGDYMDEVDSYDFIYSQVKNLRKKLKLANAQVSIDSIYGMGYKLIDHSTI